MPKPTFFRLPADKRERFVAEALEEFARHPYDQASVSAIVERLGIAKGSVYQYFNSKRDLFEWLILEAGKRRRAWAEELNLSPEVPYFERLRELYRVGLEHWRDEPLWNRLRLRMLEPSRDETLEAFRQEITRLAHEGLKTDLEQAQRDGWVRADLDLDVVTHLVMGTLQQGLLQAYFGKAGVDMAHLPDDPEAAANLPQEALLEVVDTAVDFLQRGLGA